MMTRLSIDPIKGNITSRIVNGSQDPRRHGNNSRKKRPKTTRGPPYRKGKSPKWQLYRPSHHADEAL